MTERPDGGRTGEARASPRQREAMHTTASRDALSAVDPKCLEWRYGDDHCSELNLDHGGQDARRGEATVYVAFVI
jgi:hypothetical protein